MFDQIISDLKALVAYAKAPTLDGAVEAARTAGDLLIQSADLFKSFFGGMRASKPMTQQECIDECDKIIALHRSGGMQAMDPRSLNWAAIYQLILTFLQKFFPTPAVA